MANPYAELVGQEWESLPPGVRRAHTAPLDAHGKFVVLGPTSRLGALASRFIKLPPVGPEIAVRLSLEAVGSSIRWIRRFGTMTAVSEQSFEKGLFVERTGPYSLLMRVSRQGDSLRHCQVGLRLWGLRVPRILGPTVVGRVGPEDDDSSWRVTVCISHPWLGEICSYAGVLTAE